VTRKLEEFIQGRGPGDGGVDAFLAAQPFPIVEGERVTFVYRGRAEAVKLWHPGRAWSTSSSSRATGKGASSATR
jgi:hypothetical protein